MESSNVYKGIFYIFCLTLTDVVEIKVVRGENKKWFSRFRVGNFEAEKVSESGCTCKN